MTRANTYPKSTGREALVAMIYKTYMTCYVNKVEVQRSSEIMYLWWHTVLFPHLLMLVHLDGVSVT